MLVKIELGAELGSVPDHRGVSGCASGLPMGPTLQRFRREAAQDQEGQQHIQRTESIERSTDWTKRVRSDVLLSLLDCQLVLGHCQGLARSCQGLTPYGCPKAAFRAGDQRLTDNRWIKRTAAPKGS